MVSFFANKPQQNLKKKLFLISLFTVYLSLVLLVFSFRLKPPFNDTRRLQSKPPSTTTEKPSWFDIISDEFGDKRVKIGLVNIDECKTCVHAMYETVKVGFDGVSDSLKWGDLFPEWIDENHKWGPPKCPEIPLPGLDDYRDLDVIVAKLPCEKWTEKEGVRDVYRLQVNLVVANLVVASGWPRSDSFDRTVYVVFVGSCEPMREMFRCDDFVKRVGDHRVYKPDFWRLKHKVLMPFGSCQIAPPYALTGKEGWRPDIPESTTSNNLNNSINHQREAYVTILHSSEAYVCGAIALAQSIKQQNSTKDLVLLHDKTIGPKSLEGLQAAGWQTRFISRIKSPFSRKGSYNEWNYSKLRVWQLKDYNKVLFIDADFLLLQNIDHFFFYPQLSAAANDRMLFNSGLMLIEPSKCGFEELMLKIFKVPSYNGGDQGFLNEVFTWWHRWPKKLNYLKDFQEAAGNEKHEIPENLYAIHFLGLKPWMCYRDYDCNWDMVERHRFASDSAHRKWWEVHDKMPKNLQKYCSLTKEMDARIRKWRRIAKNSSLADGHWKIVAQDPRRHHLVE